MGLDAKPFPDGEERERINAACAKLFDLIRGEGVLAKALALFEEPLAES
jgi:hypothetical protein